MYIALIADMISSRDIENRTEVQERLKEVLGKLNEKYAEEIAAKFTITLGDEFQGLLKTPIHLIEMIDQIKREMYPVNFRIGVGIGAITTVIDPEVAIGADGPAFYVARDAIEAVENGNAKNEQARRDIELKVEGKTNAIIDLLNASLASCYYIEASWTDKQRETVMLLMETSDISQKQIAETLGVKQSSAHRRVQASGYYTYAYIKESVIKAINELWEDLINE